MKLKDIATAIVSFLRSHGFNAREACLLLIIVCAMLLILYVMGLFHLPELITAGDTTELINNTTDEMEGVLEGVEISQNQRIDVIVKGAK